MSRHRKTRGILKESEKIVFSFGGRVMGICLLVLMILFPTVVIPLMSLWAILLLVVFFFSVFLPIFIRSGSSRWLSSVDSFLSLLLMPLLPLFSLFLLLGQVFGGGGGFSRSGGVSGGGGFGGFGGGSFGGGGASGSW